MTSHLSFQPRARLSFRPKEKSCGKEHRYFVYLLTNWNNKVMYIGMTNNLVRRVYEHKTKAVQRFHGKVQCAQARLLRGDLRRECLQSRAKKGNQEMAEGKKNALVVEANPEWSDLGPDMGLSPWHFDPSCHFERSENLNNPPIMRQAKTGFLLSVEMTGVLLKG